MESRGLWDKYQDKFCAKSDLVLTFDFGLKNAIKTVGGEAIYIDAICSPEEMQRNNLLTSEFFKKWHYDKFGKDIFHAQEVAFGFAFRIEIWSELFYYVRIRANLQHLRSIKCDKIFVCEETGFLSNVIKEVGLDFISLRSDLRVDHEFYFFDIHKYMYDALHAKSIKNILKNTLSIVLSNIRLHADNFLKYNSTKTRVYAQIYHPTKSVVGALLGDPNLSVVTSSLISAKGWKKFFFQRLIPIRGFKKKFYKTADLLLGDFNNKRWARLVLTDGTDVTEGAYSMIERQLKPVLPDALRILDSVISYVENHPFKAEIMIANIGLVQTIVNCVLKTKGVPSYLVINGLMPTTFGDESKYASYINCYGPETKKNYFQNADNVVCLGDPRMDSYCNSMEFTNKVVNRLRPTIGIGASGFNNIDLISNVAAEFDFMFDILTALQELKNEGQSFSVVIKVRPNGVLQQYESFVSEYFGQLEIKLIQNMPMNDVLEKIDLYISIASQTLFEASCLGIPVIYYKKDKEFLLPPFDQKSELVTICSVNELKRAFYDFKALNSRFDAFLEKSVMEKYVGPLDGKNLERNLSFIYQILNGDHIGGCNEYS